MILNVLLHIILLPSRRVTIYSIKRKDEDSIDNPIRCVMAVALLAVRET